MDALPVTSVHTIAPRVSKKRSSKMGILPFFRNNPAVNTPAVKADLVETDLVDDLWARLMSDTLSIEDLWNGLSDGSRATPYDVAMVIVRKLGQTLESSPEGVLPTKCMNVARRLPDFVTDMAAAISITNVVCMVDPQFQSLIQNADIARDRRAWSEAEALYWQALELYPQCPGYTIQYAHCLKEQGKFVDAEAYYRQALAIGALSADVLQHLEFTVQMAGRSYGSAVEAVVAFWNKNRGRSDIGPLEYPPTRSTVQDLYELLHDRANITQEDICDAMSRRNSRASLVKALIGEASFTHVHRDMLRVVKETDWQA